MVTHTRHLGRLGSVWRHRLCLQTPSQRNHRCILHQKHQPGKSIFWPSFNPGTFRQRRRNAITDFNVMFGLTVMLRHQAVKRVRSWRSHSFLTLILFVWLVLLMHCRCTGLLLYLNTLNDTRTFRMTPLDEGSARRRDLYLYNTQHSLETNMHGPGWIRTRNSRNRAAADLRS